MALILKVVCALVALISGCCSLEYWVGGDSVWAIPPYPDYYNDWSSSHFFCPADSLVFNFETEVFNVMEVAMLEYQSCSTNNPVQVHNVGPATIQLNQPGVFYFLCNLSNYCDLGLKIIITVQYPNFSATPSQSPPPPLLSLPFLPPSPSSAPPQLQPPSPLPSGEWNSSSNNSSSGSPPPRPMAGSDAAPSPPSDLGHTKSCVAGCGAAISVLGCVSVFYFFLFGDRI